MSSSIDKEFGDMFIHGIHPDGRVNVILSAHGFELDLGLMQNDTAQKLIIRWNNLKDKAEENQEFAWRCKELSE